LLDSPGFDFCNIKSPDKVYSYINHSDLILFIVSGDLNRNELKEINSFIGKETSDFLLSLSFFTQVTINLSLQAINNSRNAYFCLSKTDGSPNDSCFLIN